MESEPLLIPSKKIYFKENGSILKISTHTGKKDTEAAQGYFKPRSNIKTKNKRGILRKMAFKTYLQLSLPIAIQHITEYGATEAKKLDTITEIWKVLLLVHRHNVILSWHLKTEDTLKPLTSMDCTKTLTKKVVNDKYIELLQMGWFTSNTTIRLGWATTYLLMLS